MAAKKKGDAEKRKAPRGKHTMTERQTEALRMRYRRASYQTIGDKLYNGSAGNAHTDIQAALKVIQKDEADDVRMMELELLDEIIRPQLYEALKGNPKAFDRVLRGMQRRSSYLGLDAPKDVTLGGSGTVIVEFDSRLDGERQTEPDIEVDGDDD